jgi:hypothetical protein
MRTAGPGSIKQMNIRISSGRFGSSFCYFEIYIIRLYWVKYYFCVYSSGKPIALSSGKAEFSGAAGIKGLFHVLKIFGTPILVRIDRYAKPVIPD